MHFSSTFPDLLNPEFTDKTRIYWLITGMTDYCHCKVCNKPIVKNINRISIGYSNMTCSPECGKRLMVEHVKATCISKYGVCNAFVAKKDEIKAKNIEKYGNACPANNKDIRKKICDANEVKYGVKSYSQTVEWHDKVKATNNERYGHDNAIQNGDIKLKARQTNLRKYGVPCTLQAPEVADRITEKYIDTYGEDYSKIVWGGKGNDWQIQRSYMYMTNSVKVRPLFTLDQLLECRHQGNDLLQFECKKCGTHFKSYWDNGNCRCCPNCLISVGGTSEAEGEIFNFIKEICPNDDIELNNRKIISPLELDIVDMTKRIAVEYDGLYWHKSEIHENSDYHLNKTIRCADRGFKLIHIFENEWLLNADVVKHNLKMIFCDKVQSIDDLSVKEICLREAQIFHELHNIHGSSESSINVGLVDSHDKLKSVMSFDRICDGWRLSRHSSCIGYHSNHSTEQLLRYFETTYHPNKIMIDVDYRWDDGKMYESLGFSYQQMSTPTPWYFKHNTIELIPEVLCECKFNDTLSDSENSKNTGYSRIFDCGTRIFVKQYV